MSTALKVLKWVFLSILVFGVAYTLYDVNRSDRDDSGEVTFLKTSLRIESVGPGCQDPVSDGTVGFTGYTQAEPLYSEGAVHYPEVWYLHTQFGGRKFLQHEPPTRVLNDSCSIEITQEPLRWRVVRQDGGLRDGLLRVIAVTPQ